MHHRPTLSLILLLLFAAPGHALTWPGHRPATDNGLLLKVQNSDIGAKAAARAVRRATGGRVLAVKRIQTGNGPAYRVKALLKGGRIRILLVDAASGALR